MLKPVLARSPVVERTGRRGRLRAAQSWFPFILLLLGAGLRLPGLFVYPFEQDELYTVIEATELFDSPLRPGIQARPLYYLMHHTVIDLIPQTHAGLRLPAFIFGVVGIWLTWVVGSRVIGATAGMIAMTMVVISPWHLHASGMARYWSLVYVLSIAFYFYLHRASATRQPRDYLLALLFLVLGSVTHPTFIFPVVGVVFALGGGRGPRLHWPARQALAYLWAPFGALVLLALGYIFITGNQSEVRNFDGRGLLATLRLLPAMVQWMTPTIFVTGVLGSVLLQFDTAATYRRWGALALLGSGAALFLLAVASLVTDVYADYGMAVLPFFFISTGALVQLGTRRLPASAGGVLGWAAAGVLVAGILPSTLSHLSDGTRFDYRPAFRQIAVTAPDLPVLTWPIVLQQRYAPELEGRELAMTRQFLESQLVRGGDFWAVIPVQRYGIVMDGTGEVGGWLNANCRLSESHQRPRLDYRMYRVDLYRCGPGT